MPDTDAKVTSLADFKPRRSRETIRADRGRRRAESATRNQNRRALQSIGRWERGPHHEEYLTTQDRARAE